MQNILMNICIVFCSHGKNEAEFFQLGGRVICEAKVEYGIWYGIKYVIRLLWRKNSRNFSG